MTSPIRNFTHFILAEAKATIWRIDQEIAALRRAIRKLDRIDLDSAASWQAAWDRHPELHQQERELYRQRGVAQQVRDEAETKIWRAARRRAKRFAAKHLLTA